MVRIIVCPKCRFKFDISYGRAFACAGCQSAVIHQCDMAKCPKCQWEFPLNEQQAGVF